MSLENNCCKSVDQSPHVSSSGCGGIVGWMVWDRSSMKKHGIL